MTDGEKMPAHYSPHDTHASLSWLGDPEDEEEEEEEKKKEQKEDDEEDEDNEGEEKEVPWQVEKRKASQERRPRLGARRRSERRSLTTKELRAPRNKQLHHEGQKDTKGDTYTYVSFFPSCP
jgi:hypothetical protein